MSRLPLSDLDLRDLPRYAPAVPRLEQKARRRAWFNMVLTDHGFLREIYCNLRRIDADAWRAAQPAPRHVRKYRAMGIRTIVNLRGPQEKPGAYHLERELCREIGIVLIDFPIRSRKAVERPTLIAACELFAHIRYPVLFHCKSGADRAGFFSTLYLHVHKGVPLRDAMRHLSPAYGHIRQSKTGVLDFLFESYLKDAADTGLSLPEWAETRYDPAGIDAGFRANWTAGMLIDYVLRRE